MNIKYLQTHRVLKIAFGALTESEALEHVGEYLSKKSSSAFHCTRAEMVVFGTFSPQVQ